MTYSTLRNVLCACVMLAAATANANAAPRQAPGQQPSSSLVLAADVEGRFIIRNAAKELIAEVSKPAGRTLSVALDPGAYEVRVERDKSALIANVNVADGAAVVLDRRQLGPVPVEVSSVAAPVEVMPYSVTSRNRFDMRFGAWSHGNDHHAMVLDGVDASNLLGGIRYTRYFTESLAATFSIEGGGGQAGTFVSANGVYDGASGVVSFPVGVRWNPLTFGRQADGIKPYLAFSAGPVFGDSVADYTGRYRGDHVESSATIGGFVGGGVDFHAGRTFVIGVDGGYNWMGDFARPIGVSDNYSGPSMSISLGCMWGRGAAPRP